MIIAGLRWFRVSAIGRRPESPTSPWQVIGWWEARRIPFNLAVGIAGAITSCAIVLITVVLSVALDRPLEPSDPPLFVPALMATAVIAYAIVANACYTGGWIAELIVRRAWPDHAEHFGPITFTLGFWFSIVLTLLPAPTYLVGLVLFDVLDKLLTA